jgi:hypothetical protein
MLRTSTQHCLYKPCRPKVLRDEEVFSHSTAHTAGHSVSFRHTILCKREPSVDIATERLAVLWCHAAGASATHVSLLYHLMHSVHGCAWRATLGQAVSSCCANSTHLHWLQHLRPSVSSSCSTRYCSTHAFDDSTLLSTHCKNLVLYIYCDDHECVHLFSVRSDIAVLPVSTRKATSSSSYQLFSFV